MSRSAAMRKLPQITAEATRTIRADYDRAKIEGGLATLKELSELGVELVYDQTVEANHASLVSLTDLLAHLSYAGVSMLRAACEYPDLAREFERAIPAALRKLRILRALASILADDESVITDVNEVEAVAEARRIIRERAKEAARDMSPEELAMHAAEPQPSQMFKAWAAASKSH